MSFNITDKIYMVRGQKVMLDADLAKIYGYTTKALNQQVQRNKEKFEGGEFMFQLTRKELEEILMCHFGTSRLRSQFATTNFDGSVKSQIVTSRNLTMFAGQNGGVRKLPYAFTEQGIYMLMTVLKGELAVKQSRMLVMAFKAMKDYVVKNKILPELSPVFLDFSKTMEHKEFLLLDGEPVQAKEAYMEIYKHAKKKIYIIDNYVNIKTLHLLQMVKQNLEIIFFTDNVRNYLRKSDLEDFKKERPDLEITFIKNGGRVHDRFIILDNKRAYQAGSSSKDAGNKITSIHEITEKFIINSLLNEVNKLKRNGLVKLK